VRAQRSRWERVTDNDEFVGRLSFVDRFPQYLMTCNQLWQSDSTAMFTGAVVVA
jgi:hypothetical protein